MKHIVYNYRYNNSISDLRAVHFFDKLEFTLENAFQERIMNTIDAM